MKYHSRVSDLARLIRPYSGLNQVIVRRLVFRKWFAFVFALASTSLVVIACSFALVSPYSMPALV